MARVLYDGLVEYEDKTPATTSQMAKDVVEFLNWAAEPEMDQRKKMGWAAIIITSSLLALSIWVKRFVFLPVSLDHSGAAMLEKSECLGVMKFIRLKITAIGTNGPPSSQGRSSTTHPLKLGVIRTSS